jgi:hypothetical protein
VKIRPGCAEVAFSVVTPAVIGNASLPLRLRVMILDGEVVRERRPGGRGNVASRTLRDRTVSSCAGARDYLPFATNRVSSFRLAGGGNAAVQHDPSLFASCTTTGPL